MGSGQKQAIGLTTTLFISFSVIPGAIAQPPGNCIWLDQETPANWNKPGASLPKTSTSRFAPGTLQQCKATIRPATAPEDKALNSAGWKNVAAQTVVQPG